MTNKPLFRGFFVFERKNQRDFSGVCLATKEQQIAQLLQPTVEAMGFELWGVEYVSQGRHSVLRVYIDAEKGITVDDCARSASRPAVCWTWKSR